MYKEIKSKFIKNKLTGLKLNDKNEEYVSDLITIEKYVLGKLYGLGTGYIINSLKDRYPQEYNAIYKELNPKGLEKSKLSEAKEKKQEKIETKKLKKDEDKEKIKSKKEWFAMGGIE